MNARGIGRGRDFRGGDTGVSVDIGDRGRVEEDNREFDLGIRVGLDVLAGETDLRPY